jgi:hypothetical protein
MGQFALGLALLRTEVRILTAWHFWNTKVLLYRLFLWMASSDNDSGTYTVCTCTGLMRATI